MTQRTRRQVLGGAGAAAMIGIAGCTTGDEGATAEPAQLTEAIGDGELILATTTSTYDTGLLDAVVPTFESAFGMTVKMLPQGTGAAIETARNGDADVLLVHARSREDAFMQAGYGVNRRDMMFNDFVIVGPAADPAGIAGGDSAAGAFDAIAAAEATFVSRGDNSGTHTKELVVWDRATSVPGGRWYQEIGKGMGDTLAQASQTGAYTISDRGTYLSMREEVDLEILVEGPLRGGPLVLKNPYGVMAVNPAVHAQVNYQAAMAFIGFCTAPDTQAAIDAYTANGSQLFFANAWAEPVDFAQYVPAGYSVDAAARLTAEDRQFLSWVDAKVPAGY